MPWSKRLLNKFGVASEHSLDLVRGSHVLVKGKISKSCVLQVPKEKRIIFVLLLQGETHIGTTERKMESLEEVQLREVDVDYLLQTYNQYFTNTLSRCDVLETFYGIRPIVSSGKTFQRVQRILFRRNGKLLNVFGASGALQSLLTNLFYLWNANKYVHSIRRP